MKWGGIQHPRSKAPSPAMRYIHWPFFLLITIIPKYFLQPAPRAHPHARTPEPAFPDLDLNSNPPSPLPRSSHLCGLSGRSLRRALRVQVVARGRRRKRSSRLLPPVLWALAPGVGFREPISFINCSLIPILHQSSFLQSPLSTRRRVGLVSTRRSTLSFSVRSLGEPNAKAKQEAQCFFVSLALLVPCASRRAFLTGIRWFGGAWRVALKAERLAISYRYTLRTSISGQMHSYLSQGGGGVPPSPHSEETQGQVGVGFNLRLLL